MQVESKEITLSADARMYGRLGWHGQCLCCSTNAGKRTERMRENTAWRRDVERTIGVSQPETDSTTD